MDACKSVDRCTFFVRRAFVVWSASALFIQKMCIGPRFYTPINYKKCTTFLDKEQLLIKGRFSDFIEWPLYIGLTIHPWHPLHRCDNKRPNYLLNVLNENQAEKVLKLWNISSHTNTSMSMYHKVNWFC